MEAKQYTTERGVTIGVVPIPLLLDKIRQAHPEPDAPTYTEHLAGGATQEVTITPSMAATWMTENPEGWAQHAEAWAAYQAALTERTQLLNDRLWKAVLKRSIVVTLPPDGRWVEEQESFGITVPAEPAERQEHYIWTECIGGQADIIQIMGLAAGVNLTGEQLAAAEASFLDTLSRPAAVRAAGQGGAVADGHAGGAGADGQGLGAKAE